MLLDVTRRVFHCTFYKCGSQWVRDILTDPAAAPMFGYHLGPSGIDVPSSGWPDATPGSVCSPFYSASYDDWRANAGPNDRTVLVLRDPRDIVISMVYSVAYSHTPDPVTMLLRSTMQSASPADRITLAMYLLTQWSERMRSWSHTFDTRPEGLLILPYESILQDERAAFERVFRFLGWNCESDVVARLAAEHTFQARSGRAPGQENEFSHRRKGIAGDWRNHFDRATGRLFEETFPLLLQYLHYETSEAWWESVPEHREAGSGSRDQSAQLTEALEAQEAELGVLRKAAGERLHDVHDLVGQVNALRAESIEATEAARSRLEQVEELTNAYRLLSSAYQAVEGQARERLRQLENASIETQSLQATVARHARLISVLRGPAKTPGQVA